MDINPSPLSSPPPTPPPPPPQTDSGSLPTPLQERPYNTADLLNKQRTELVAMVQRQRDRWPWKDKRRKFNASKTRYDDLKAALLDPKHGFTTVSPSTTAGNADGDGGGAADAVEGMQPARAEPDATHRTVRVLIEDRRPTFRGLPALKAVETVDLEVLDAVGCSPGEWRASANQLISRLQVSCAAIEGLVKLSYPDPIDPQYSQYFVKMADGEALVDVETSSSALVIPTGGTLQIFVEAVSDVEEDSFIHDGSQAVKELDTRTSITDHNDLDDDVGNWDRDFLDQQPPKRRRRTANEVLTPEYAAEKRAARGEVDKQEIAWLEQKACEMPGHGAFVNSRGRTLQNAEVVTSWRFAAAFSAQYVGKLSGVTGPSSRVRRVKKKNIIAALGRGSTWFSQAERGVQLVSKYREGSHAAPEVQSMLQHHDPDPAGSGALLSFLRAWDAKHSQALV